MGTFSFCLAGRYSRLTTRKSLTTVGGPNLFLYNLIENDFVGQVLWEISRPNILS